MSVLGAIAWTACEPVDTKTGLDGVSAGPGLDEVAVLLAEIGVGRDQAGEVYDAVASSAENGYDEEYMMKDVFESPGSGVGDSHATKGVGYERPLRDLIREGLQARATRSDAVDVDAWTDALESSDIQIYWPYSELWDGVTLPVISFDPGDESDTNVGYFFSDGAVSEVLVDEQLATERPVWIVNRNDDSSLTTLEMRRRDDPDWGSGGGSITVTPTSKATSSTGHRMLVLKSIKALRNYDCWFAGASELSFKAGSADGFTASTETELKLYQPTITDFDLVLRRRDVSEEVELNTILVSDWTDQIENCVLLISEWDGGTQTSWKCSIVAKYNSKSYGLDVEIPYHQKDDIVWRGQLSRSYIEANSGRSGHFGEIDLVFELVEY